MLRHHRSVSGNVDVEILETAERQGRGITAFLGGGVGNIDADVGSEMHDL